MSKKGKRVQTTVWVPKPWIEWSEQYFKENKEDLKFLGVNSPSDLIWRVAEFGKEPLDDVVKRLKDQSKHQTSQQHETSI